MTGYLSQHSVVLLFDQYTEFDSLLPFFTFYLFVIFTLLFIPDVCSIRKLYKENVFFAINSILVY